MLKKSDLAKQFELVVQQEIKNYNDNLNNVLESIRQLSKEIREVRETSQANYATIHSVQSNLISELDQLKDAVKKMSEQCDRTFSDQSVVNERNALEMKDITGAFLNKISVDSNFQEKLREVWNHIRKLESQHQDNQRMINDNLDDILRRFRQEILKAKKEILDTPTEASLVKRELEEKIFSHIVDVAGIMRELRIYKHDNMVTEKKIENIYTLIERLKKSQGE